MANNYTFSCHSQNPSNQALEITIVRLLPSGAFDNSFSGDGRLVTSLGSGANAIDNPVRALFPLNIFTPPLIVVGYQQAADGDSGNFVGVGYNADGSLATMWGDQGIVLEQMPGYGHSTFYDGFTLGDGKVAVFGWVEN